jgi:two-component system sensor histidine kinase DesK
MSAGIHVQAAVSTDPPPEAAAVLVPVVREAVTNILKHSSASHCVLQLTSDGTGHVRLLVSNDGSDDTGSAPLATAGRAGDGLRNLAARLEAAGGHLTATRGKGSFSLAVELPLA